MENFNTEKFITEIENRPPIWDSSLEEYSNRELRRQCWDEVIEIFGNKCLTATQKRYMEITLQKKWKALRGCFTRELKRQERCNAGENSGPRKSEYLHFQQLSFLKKVVTTRPTCPGNADYIYYEEPPIRFDIKREESDDNDYGKSDEANIESDDGTDPLKEEHRETKRPKYDSLTEDEDKLFLLSMLRTLQSIPVEKKMATKIKLMTVLDEATRNIDN